MHFLFHLDANEQAEKWGNSKFRNERIYVIVRITNYLVFFMDDDIITLRIICGR